MADTKTTITIQADDKTARAFQKAIKSANKLEKEGKNLERTYTGVKAAIGAIGGAVILRGIVNTVVEFEKLEASLRTVTGSADLAASEFEKLKAFSSTTPFQLQEVTQAYIKLKALGLDPTESSLASFGNTASAMGKTLDQFVEAVADAVTGEFERLKEFGIKARSEGENVAFTFQGVTTTIGKNAEEIEAYLKRIGEVQFAGAMGEQMQTLGGAFSNLQDQVSLLSAEIGEAGLSKVLSSSALLVSDFTGEIREMIEKLGDGADAVDILAGAFAGLFLGDELQQLTDMMDREHELINQIKALESGTGNIRGRNRAGGALLAEKREELALVQAQIKGLQSIVSDQSAAAQSTRQQAEAKKKLEEETTAASAAAEAAADAEKIWAEERAGIQTQWLQQHKQEIEQWRQLEQSVVHFGSEIEAAEKATEKLDRAGTDLGFTFASAAEDAIVNWQGFGDLAKGIFQDIQRVIARKTLIEPFLEPLGNAASGFLSGLIPSFDVGTPYVPQDTLAFVHKGEAIIPAAENKPGRNGGMTVQQTINIDARNSDISEAKLYAAARQGAEAGYQMVMQDFATNGPARQLVGS